MPFFSRGSIRITPAEIVSWHLEGPRASRTVRGESSQEPGYTDLSGWLLAKLCQPRPAVTAAARRDSRGPL